MIALMKISGVFLLLLSFNGYSLTADQYAPYYVTSQQVIYKRAEHLTIYIGNVHATQGTTELDGEQLLVYNSPHHSVIRIIAQGNLAHYRTLPDNEKTFLLAQADTIEYKPTKAKVWLTGNAQVNFKENIFKGPRLWYDLKKQTAISPNTPGKTSTTLLIAPQDEI